MKTTQLIFAVCCLFLLSCTEQVQEAPIEPEALDFEGIHLDRKSVSCEKEDQPCATAKVNYVRATAGDDTLVANINGHIERGIMRMISVYDSLQPNATIESLTDKFVLDFETMQEELQFQSSWSIEIDAAVAYNGDDFVTLSANTYSYTGGAHGNGFVKYVTFDKATKQEIALEDYIVVNENFQTFYDTAFKTQHEVSASYKEDGRFFEIGEQIPVAKEFGILEDSVIFFYNTYEIAPYVSGTFEIKIPKEDLKPYLQNR